MSAPRPLSVSGYETLMELGRGGMGVAYLARSTGAGGFERFVVIKRLHRHLLEDPEALRRFLHEARLAAYVNHVNVVDVQHADSDADGPYMVLDYVEGASLDELSDRAALKGREIPLPVLLRITLDILAGLQAIHTARQPDGEPLQVLHRDLSPHNVLVGRDGVSRVADFGVAKSTLKTAETDRGYLVGKILYMAPEYLKQERVGPSLDIYAVGVSLWVTLAGTEPWPNADDAQLMAKIFSTGFPPIENSTDVPPQVAAIVNRACAVDARARYESAAQMTEAIEELGRQTSWVASHGEVARFVEELAAPDLERRRRVVAQAGKPTESAVDSARLIGTLPRRESHAIDLTRPKREDRTMGAVSLAPKAPPATSRLRWVLAFTLLAGGIGAAVGIAGLWMRDGASPAASSAPAAERPEEPVQAPPDPSSASGPQVNEPLPAEPESTAAAVAPQAPRSAPVVRTARARAPRPPTATAEAAPKQAPAPALVEPPPRATPQAAPAQAPAESPTESEITKKNPYLR